MREAGRTKEGKGDDKKAARWRFASFFESSAFVAAALNVRPCACMSVNHLYEQQNTRK